MDSTSQVINDKESMVDPFLVEALQNPRHRLTILRMELDIQRFLQSLDEQQFEFQHFPTSYLRLAAHRVAQHYGLATMVQDNGMDDLMNKILVKKTAESRYPLVRLSEIPGKQPGSEKPENVKIVIRPRPNKGSMEESNEFGAKRSHVRSMEERKEEYDKARARIFCSPGSPHSDDIVYQASPDGKSASPCKEDNEIGQNFVADAERYTIRNGSSSRVAIFRDKEKDLTDPDYDRSYGRYVRSFPANQSFGMAPLSMPKVHLPFVQYDTSYPHMAQLPGAPASVSYRPAANPVMSPFGNMASNEPSRDAAYMQWPSASKMYAHSYDQLRHAVFQAPFCQQPLSFDYSQHHNARW